MKNTEAIIVSCKTGPSSLRLFICRPACLQLSLGDQLGDGAGQGADLGSQVIETLLDSIQPRIELVQPTVDLVEAAVDLVEAAVDRAELGVLIELNSRSWPETNSNRPSTWDSRVSARSTRCLRD